MLLSPKETNELRLLFHQVAEFKILDVTDKFTQINKIKITTIDNIRGRLIYVLVQQGLLEIFIKVHTKYIQTKSILWIQQYKNKYYDLNTDVYNVLITFDWNRANNDKNNKVINWRELFEYIQYRSDKDFAKFIKNPYQIWKEK